MAGNPNWTSTKRSNLFNRLRLEYPVLFPLAIFAVLVIFSGILSEKIQTSQIGVLTIEGPIIDSKIALKQIKELKEAPTVKAVMVRINSPGGAVVPSQEIYEELKALKQTKPVYSSIGSLGASGGYYIAIAGEKIFAMPGSLTGSIGVIMETVNTQELFDKLGLKFITLKAGKNKDIGNSNRPMQPHEKQLIEEMLQDTHSQFLSDVMEARGFTLQEVQKIGDGRIFTGRQAKKAGLVDELMTFNQAFREVIKELNLPEDTTIYKPDKPHEEFFSEVAAQSLLKLMGKYGQGGLFYK